MKLKAIIIDDEPFARDDLRYLLSGFADIEIIGEAGRVDEAKKMLSRSRPDVVFLDIELRGGTGFDLVPFIDPKTSVIFITAHDKYAQQALQTGAVGCIPKPVSMDRLTDSLKHLHRSNGEQDGGPVQIPQ